MWVCLLLCSCDRLMASPDAQPQCAKRSGSYRTTFKLRSGNCATLDTQVLGAAEIKGAKGTACTYESAEERRFGDQSTMTMKSVGQWSADASLGLAVVQFKGVAKAGETECYGSFDVTYDRL